MLIKTMMALTAASVFVVASAQAQTQNRAPTQSGAQTRPQTPVPAQALAATDREFAIDAIRGNNGEIQVGKLAVDKARSDVVKGLARHLTKDHADANEKLAGIARKHNVEVPSEADEDSKKLIQRLSGLAGERFEGEYVSAMVDGHQKTIDRYTKAATEAKDTDLKNYFSETLPKLREHHAEAMDLRRRVQPRAGTPGGSAIQGSPPATPNR